MIDLDEIDLDGIELVAARPGVVAWIEDLELIAHGGADAVDVVVDRRDRVVAVGSRARAAGIPLGARAPMVRARLGDGRVVAVDPIAEARWLARVHRALWSVSPGVGQVAGVRGAFAIEARAARRFYGTEYALVERVRAALDGTVPTRVALGASIAGALIATVAGATTDGGGAEVGSRAWFAAQPVELLPRWLAGPLRDVGVRRVGGFQRIDTAAVAARFGDRGLRWHRLVRLEADLPLVRTPPLEPDAVAIDVEEGEDAQSVRFRLRGALDLVLAEHADVAPARWRSFVDLEGAVALERVVERPVGGTAAEILESVRALSDRAEGARGRPVRVGVEILAWSVPQPPQLSLDGVPGARRQAVRQAFHVLQQRYGPEAVRVAGPGPVGRGFADRRPWVSWTGVWPVVDDRVGTGAPWPGHVPGLTPTRVPERLQAVVLLDAHGMAVEVDRDGVLSAPPAVLDDGEGPERIEAAHGPWVVRERWWERRRARYARLVLATERRWCWVRREHGRWWLEGSYE
ncbi:putative DNA-directed DNA polymerase [Acidimicrobium ferrooxidans DSM 10331]|uniref:Putative DNA-directed DNA polymerase n=1 Tax=Acidimicrobium ferrooxidans (strain DSM 10331 / JCM 15462 / NBRC 103882 / ICP) TaxID=525909 RepID=C7M0M6_ACIFD|nr:DNA-directed DNA polymerase [Acidimicrobium ferrooxidans]ACU54534.1 putative DNA-directed DNA polymerase [Acidimicrobium ferrooxidans DSM 10331]